MVSVGGKEIDASNQKYVEKLSRAGRKGSYWLSSDLDLRAEFSDSELYICLLKLLAMLEEVLFIFSSILEYLYFIFYFF